MDRIDAIRAFTAVVRESSFTRAAARLDLSPQLVSKYVAQLEEQLGVRLLHRTTRRVNPTEAGTRYFQGARQLLDDFDDLEAQLGDLQQEARGTLHVSAPVSFASRHLGPLIRDFQQQFPAVRVDLQLNDRKVDIIEEGFDIALRVGHLRSSSLVARRIVPVRLVSCASPDYLARHGTPTSLAELAGHRYLRYSLMDSGNSTPLHDALEKGDDDGTTLVSNNGDVLSAAAIAGGGITIQPTFICGDAVADGRLVRILPEMEPPPMAMYAVYTHRRLLASKVRVFVDFAAGYFGDPPYWDRFE